MTDRFNAKTAALVLIDHQVGTLQLVKTMSSALTLSNAVALARAATILGMPVVLTSSQEDQVQGPIAPELQAVVPDAFVARIQRAGVVNAWDDLNFKAAVEATGRRQLVMAGVTTDICLVFPSISAVDEGFAVRAVLDASGSPFEISEYAARRQMENAGVTMTTTNSVLAELAQDWSTPEGMELAKIEMELLPTMELL